MVPEFEKIENQILKISPLDGDEKCSGEERPGYYQIFRRGWIG
jgi:hypothetical protein